MTDRNILTLRRADQARSDFALLESNLEIIAGRLARLPTRRELAQAARLSKESNILLRQQG